MHYKKENYFYVGKTDVVWKLAHHAAFIFMSRPRRFVESLLTSTLEAYFNGDKEHIMQADIIHTRTNIKLKKFAYMTIE